LAAERYRDALTLCAERYGSQMGRVCMAMLGSQAEAEEAAQEALLSAYQSFANYRNEGSVAAWLMGIARKKCLKQLEARRRQQAQAEQILPAEPAPNAEEALQQRERAARARAALQEVRPTEREALVLRFAGELSFEGVAQACDVDPAAARKRVSRGLARLRAVLTASEQVANREAL
jgi:RNA polymerase sigma-70 factor, ECF subfamily